MFLTSRSGSWKQPGERGPDALDDAHSVLWTPTVTVTPRQLDQQVPILCRRFSAVVSQHPDPDGGGPGRFTSDMWNVQLLIVDEAERLKPGGLEQLRDYFDRHPIGLILIGMPGLESAWPDTRSSTAASASRAAYRIADAQLRRGPSSSATLISRQSTVGVCSRS